MKRLLFLQSFTQIYIILMFIAHSKGNLIKIDRSLIQQIDTEILQQQLLSVLLNYAQQNAAKVIAEGIERLEEYEYICEAGVHYAQGYAVGRPYEQLVEATAPQSHGK